MKCVSFFYTALGRYKVLVPGDPKQAAISGSRCFVIPVIYGARSRPSKRVTWASVRRYEKRDDIADDKDRTRVVAVIASLYLRSISLSLTLFLFPSSDVSSAISIESIRAAAAEGPESWRIRLRTDARDSDNPGTSKSSLEKQRNELQRRP